MGDSFMKVLFLLPLFLLAACSYTPSNHSSDIVFIYSLYDSLLREKKPDIFCIIHRPLGDSIYAVILNGDFDSGNYKYCKNKYIYRIKFNKNGIYTACKDSFVLTYAFTPNFEQNLTEERKKCNKGLLPIGEYIMFTQQKNYDGINTILNYNETWAVDAGMNSYYLKNFGFLSYDYSGRRDFLLCRKSYNTGLPDSVLQTIGDMLVKDSSFFERHIINSQR